LQRSRRSAVCRAAVPGRRLSAGLEPSPAVRRRALVTLRRRRTSRRGSVSNCAPAARGSRVSPRCCGVTKATPSASGRLRSLRRVPKAPPAGAGSGRGARRHCSASRGCARHIGSSHTWHRACWHPTGISDYRASLPVDLRQALLLLRERHAISGCRRIKAAVGERAGTHRRCNRPV
jgi:hypothetical protein